MIIDSYKQKSNYERKYRLVNVNEGIDLIPFIKNKDLKYSKFEQKKDGSMSANSMSFTLTFPYNTKDILGESANTNPMQIDAEILKNYMIDYEKFIGLEIPKVNGQISLYDLVKKSDNIVLIEETENDMKSFSGIVESVKIKRNKTNIYLNVEVKDKTYSLYEMKHTEETFFQNIYLCNNLDKNNSLMHQIAYKLNFKDEELDLPDFDVIIPFVLFRKDELIIKELAYAVRLVGGVFTIEKDRLVVKSEANRIKEEYIFDKRNILTEINTENIYPNYDKLKITYDYYFEKESQDMWVLVGQNGNLEDANLVIRAGKERKFLVDWLYNVDLVKEPELYDVIFTLVDGTEINFPYILNIDETGGTLELNNKSNNYDVYVKKFKIRGIPLFMQPGNESYYPANIQSEKLLDNLENKLVQNSDLALLYLKSNYIEYCKAYERLYFTTNVNNYLEPGIKIYIDHDDFKGYAIIEKIDFQATKMLIQAREYLLPLDINDIKTLEKSNVDEYEVISNKFLTEKGLYEADLPLAPQNLVLISQALGFTITFDNFSSNLRGHFVYLKKKTDIDWMKFFISSNNHFYQTTNLVTYEVKVSSISINGVEGKTTEIKEVTPILLDNGVVDYPEGLSPGELDERIKTEKENIVKLFETVETIEGMSEEEVKKITNTAIESFSANEFIRTIGTRISKINYRDFIDNESLTYNIDDDSLVETIITDYYSVIKQTSEGILLAVKKDNIVSSLNMSPEEIKINAKRIALGSGLVVEGDQVAVRNLGAENIRAGSIKAEHIESQAITADKIAAQAITAEHISGRKIEGIEIVSENIAKTERVYIDSGKVVQQKRNSTAEEYKSYDQLVMQFSGEVNCVNGWSEIIDLKTYNNNLPWSNLNVIAFVTAQYDLSNGIATSRHIIREWVGNPSEQKIRFRVSGATFVDNTVTIPSDFFPNPAHSGIRPQPISFSKLLEKIKSININGTISSHSDGGRFIDTKLYIRIGNQSEILIAQDSGSIPKPYSYNLNLANAESVALRWTGIYPPTIAGTYVQRSEGINVNFNATVQWLAIGNS